jgi:hypothetical protein
MVFMIHTLFADWFSLQSIFHHPQRRILVTSFLVAINAPQCAEALGSSEKIKFMHLSSSNSNLDLPKELDA